LQNFTSKPENLMARTCGKVPSYSPTPDFFALALRFLANSIIEFKDVFRLRPEMPMVSNADPTILEKRFREANEPYKNIEWELEDLLSVQLLSAFCEVYPNAVSRESRAGDIVHRDLTRDGKARRHQFAKDHAIRQDLLKVIEVLKAFRRYFGLKEDGITESSGS
jgi:hypothetical protein